MGISTSNRYWILKKSDNILMSRDKNFVTDVVILDKVPTSTKASDSLSLSVSNDISLCKLGNRKKNKLNPPYLPELLSLI